MPHHCAQRQTGDAGLGSVNLHGCGRETGARPARESRHHFGRRYGRLESVGAYRTEDNVQVWATGPKVSPAKWDCCSNPRRGNHTSVLAPQSKGGRYSRDQEVRGRWYLEGAAVHTGLSLPCTGLFHCKSIGLLQ